MRGYRLRLAIAVVWLAAAAGLHAWQWPVEAPLVTATFGQLVDGYLLRGVQLATGGRPVHPVGEGVVSVVRREHGGAPTGLGSYVAIDHDHGFRSIYAHLDSDMLPLVGAIVDPATQIGVAGETGQISGRDLRLYVVDLQSGEYVNPMLLLPDLPDRTAPQIGAVYARTTDALYDLRSVRELPAGSYQIVAQITDRMQPAAGSPRIAPFEVRFLVTGAQPHRLRFHRVVIREGGAWLRPGDIATSEVYDPDGFVRLGSVLVSAEPSDLQIEAIDFAGRRAIWRARVTGLAEDDL